MKVFILVHEYKDGYTCYAFSSEEKRDEAAGMLQEEYAADFEADRDFLLFDESDLDAMPWTVGSADTHDKEKKVGRSDA